MLDGVIKNLGYTVGKPPDPEKRLEIIDKVGKGELSAETAAELLKGGSADGEDNSESKENKRGERK